MKQNLIFLLKVMTAYAVLAASFSLVGPFLPEAHRLDDPTRSASSEHVIGHIVFGMMAGAAGLATRYIVLAGTFTILLDADHLVNFLQIDAVSRMGHSIPFGIISAIIMFLIFGKKDYRLAAISFAAVLSHMSFDTLLQAGNFPLYTPFYSQEIVFQGTDWIFLQVIAIGLVGIATLYTKIKQKRDTETARNLK